MQLVDLRTEILAHGFDPTQFSASRLNQYINDGYQLICTRTQYYVDEATQDFTTVNGTASYVFPTDFGRLRSLRDTTRDIELQVVPLRMIDRSPTKTGAPLWYALDASNFHLYPTPDSNTYPLECRYWKLPATLANDTDVPSIPARWHFLLWKYAVAEAYNAEDDLQAGGQWRQIFETDLMKFQADVKFPDAEGPQQVSGMWESEESLAPRTGWSIWGSGW